MNEWMNGEKDVWGDDGWGYGWVERWMGGEMNGWGDEWKSRMEMP